MLKKNAEMDIEFTKNMALIEELETSVRLIKIGFGEYQNIGGANDFYYLPFQLISSGFERLMKCMICLGHIEKNGCFPEPNLFRNILKHDLLKLKNHIIENYFQENSKALSNDLQYIKNDKDLELLIGLLSEFGKFARYYNLNVITGEINPGIDVKASWEKFETKIVLDNKDLLEQLTNLETNNVALSRIKRIIIIKLEVFTRALARQFTLGRIGKLAQQYSTPIFEFIMLKDEELGNTNYRIHTTRFEQRNHKPHKRTIIDNYQRRFNKNYKSQIITKDNFDGDWPFYAEKVTIECRDKNWCVVTIENVDYALNGASKGKYKIEDTMEAGMSILGIDIHPFRKMALDLGKDKK